MWRMTFVDWTNVRIIFSWRTYENEHLNGFNQVLHDILQDERRDISSELKAEMVGRFKTVPKPWGNVRFVKNNKCCAL